MKTLFYLGTMLSDYQPVFKYKNNFEHFQTFVKGLIFTPSRGTMTQIYQSTKPSTTYWTLPKFLSRSKWCIDELTSVLTQQVQKVYSKGVYVYDETKSVGEGIHQYGTHFFRNTRYNKRNKNQSKFHHGHQFGAIGWLCETPQGTRLFPLAARVMCPGKTQDNSFQVLSSICAKMPPGLIIFDRGFNRRKVFTEVLSQGHQLLCRAKSNAVFYKIPKPKKRKGPGRKRIYGDRVHIPYLRYRDLVVNDKTYSVTDKVVQTKMCPQLVRLVVMRTKPDPSKPYKYFCMFTSDLQLPVAEAITHYINRWQIETAFRDVKQNFGFGTYQVRNRESLNRHVQLSFVAASLTELCWAHATTDTTSNIPSETQNDVPDLDAVLKILNIHWYKPKYLTRGIMVAYLRHSFQQQYFSASKVPQQNSKKTLKIVEDTT